MLITLRVRVGIINSFIYSFIEYWQKLQSWLLWLIIKKKAWRLPLSRYFIEAVSTWADLKSEHFFFFFNQNPITCVCIVVLSKPWWPSEPFCFMMKTNVKFKRVLFYLFPMYLCQFGIMRWQFSSELLILWDTEMSCSNGNTHTIP